MSKNTNGPDVSSKRSLEAERVAAACRVTCHVLASSARKFITRMQLGLEALGEYLIQIWILWNEDRFVGRYSSSTLNVFGEFRRMAAVRDIEIWNERKSSDRRVAWSLEWNSSGTSVPIFLYSHSTRNGITIYLFGSIKTSSVMKTSIVIHRAVNFACCRNTFFFPLFFSASLSTSAGTFVLPKLRKQLLGRRAPVKFEFHSRTTNFQQHFPDWIMSTVPW